MAVLNSQSNDATSQETTQASTQGQEQGMAQASQQPQRTQQAGGPGDALNTGSSFLGDANGFLNQLNQLLQNPIVQKRIEQKTGGQGEQNNRMMGGNQGQQAPQGQAPQGGQQAELRNHSGGQAPAQNSKEKETPQTREIRPQDIDTIEVFQAKLFDSEQRQELTQGLEQIGALVDDELDGMDTTLEELKDYLESEEFENQIEQLKEAGMA